MLNKIINFFSKSIPSESQDVGNSPIVDANRSLSVDYEYGDTMFVNDHNLQSIVGKKVIYCRDDKNRFRWIGVVTEFNVNTMKMKVDFIANGVVQAYKVSALVNDGRFASPYWAYLKVVEGNIIREVAISE